MRNKGLNLCTLVYHKESNGGFSKLSYQIKIKNKNVFQYIYIQFSKARILNLDLGALGGSKHFTLFLDKSMLNDGSAIYLLVDFRQVSGS